MLNAGTTLSTYTLDRLVGVGGAGQVWSARDTRSGELVALKLLRSQSTLPDSAHERLIREARATRAIRHPAIVPVREIFEHAGAPVLVMELLTGETLRRLLEREQRLPLERAAAVLLPVAEALVEAHRAGIAHRDLKPENIFLEAARANDEAACSLVRLLDFGVARFYVPPEGSDLTPITGLEVLLGTLSYMAPEQVSRPADCDQRVDVWAFGVTLYELLAGCRPIEGEGPQDTLRHLLIGAIVPLDMLVPELPADVAEFVARLLVRKPEARAKDLGAAVEVLARHVKRG